MKAYKAWDTKRVVVENYSTVVFAETAQKARAIAMTTDACEDAAYIDIRVTRFPEMDCHYRGRSEIDWYDMEDRKAMIALGWACLDTSWECDTCPCKPDCIHWQDDMDDAKDYPPYLDYPKPRKTTTNADRIRAMSDEELAEWLNSVTTCDCCAFSNDSCNPYDEERCLAGMKKWFKQPAEGE